MSYTGHGGSSARSSAWCNFSFQKVRLWCNFWCFGNTDMGVPQVSGGAIRGVQTAPGCAPAVLVSTSRLAAPANFSFRLRGRVFGMAFKPLYKAIKWCSFGVPIFLTLLFNMSEKGPATATHGWKMPANPIRGPNQRPWQKPTLVAG